MRKYLRRSRRRTQFNLLYFSLLFLLVWVGSALLLLLRHSEPKSVPFFGAGGAPAGEQRLFRKVFLDKILEGHVDGVGAKSKHAPFQLDEPSSLLFVMFTGRRRLWTVEALMEKVGFERNQSSSVCPPLPQSAEIPAHEQFYLGMTREFVGGVYHPAHCRRAGRRDRAGDANASNSEKKNTICGSSVKEVLIKAVKNPPKYAYILMVSNNLYLDGAMVLADSIREHSPMSRNGTADIVLMITEDVSEGMFPLLQSVFDRVQVFSGLTRWAKNSRFKGTFDKMYLFLQEDYTEGISFIDADSLLYASADPFLRIFATLTATSNLTSPSVATKDGSPHISYKLTQSEWKRRLNKKPLPFLYAFGDSTYFQTSLMFLKPSLKVFLDLYLEFRFGKYKYNSAVGRDGVLFRNCFTAPGKLVVPYGFWRHFQGKLKPWHNHEDSDRTLKPLYLNSTQMSLLPLNQRLGFYDWWTRYESLHMGIFRDIEKETRAVFGPAQDADFLEVLNKSKSSLNLVPSDLSVSKYGGTMLLKQFKDARQLPLGLETQQDMYTVSPTSYMWLMRFGANVEYLHPSRAHVAKLRTGTSPLASADELDALWRPPTNSAGPTRDRRVTYVFAASSFREGGGVAEEREWTDCDTRCAQLQLKCDASWLIDTRVGDCQHSQPTGTMANGLIRCKRCLPHFEAGAPFVVFENKAGGNRSWIQEADVCFFNAWTRFEVPRCNATRPRVSGDIKGKSFMSPICACR